MKHQPEDGCSTGRTERNEGMKEGRKEGRNEGRKEGRKEGRNEGRKYFEFLLFPFSIISIVLHRGGTELIGD